MSNLDNLRALAIVSVFCHHLSHVYGVYIPFFGVYGGIFGVQLFFLLSGYLIIQSAEKYSLKEYFKHRIFRIFPAYLTSFLILGILTDIISIALLKGHFKDLLINIFMLQHLAPTALKQFEVLHVSWTLTLELIWYLLAPFLLVQIQQRSKSVLLICIMISSLWASLANTKILDNLYISPGVIQDDNRYFYINNAFPAQLCFFVLGGYIFINRDHLIKINYLFLISFFIGVLLFLSKYLQILTNPTFVSGLGLSSLFIVALKAPAYRSSFLKWIANISYSFYLIHLVILVVAKHSWHWQGTEGISKILALTLGISTISYYLIEKPMINFARR